MKILLTDNIDQKAADLLSQAGFSVDLLPTLPKDELLSKIADYDAIAVRSATKVSKDVLAQASRLKLVVRGGVGVDNIDLKAASERGIAVANTPGANTIATAELTLALMLALARNIVAAQNSLVSGEWQRKQFRGIELFGKTLGIIGFGRIGREVAKRAQAFGMTILAYDPFLDESIFAEAGVGQSNLQEIFKSADFITLHLPLTHETRGLIGATALGSMKANARIINCARGGLIDEQALAQALDGGEIAGAALDVYESEPPAKDNPLIGHPKVVCVPHLGAYTFEAQDKVAGEVAQVIIDFLIKKLKTNVINS